MNSEAVNKVPEPHVSGSDGSQVTAEVSEDCISSQQVGRPMTNAITGLAATNSRAFGGEVASTLIAGATSQMSVELDQTKVELNEQREKNERLTQELTSEKIKSAILGERIESFRSSRHLKNIGIAIGSILLGTGVQLIKMESLAYGVSCLVIGAILIIFSWASAPKRGDK